MVAPGPESVPPRRRWLRTVVPFVAGAAFVLVVIGAVAMIGGDDSTTATTTTVAETTTTEAPPSDTTTVTTAPEEPSTTTTEPDGDALPATGYVVTGVAADDVLNIRSQPDPAAPIVGTLPPDAIDVVTTGLGTTNLPEAGWWEVALDNATTGWVNSAFLALPAAWSAPVSDFPCIADGPAYGGTSAESPAPAQDDADHVFALEHITGPDCDRYVVVLGTGGGWANSVPWPSTPATFVPGGVTVSVEGSVATIAMPMDVVDQVRPSATESILGDAMGFVVRRGAGPLDVRIHFPANRRVAVTFLDGPARIVVDARSAPTGTGLGFTPIVSGHFALPQPINVDIAGPGVTPPITVTVYGRPFEAQGSVEVRTVGSTPGTGTPVSVGFDGDFGATTAATYSYRTTDYTEAWGVGSFTIAVIPPGEYELFVGEYSPEDGRPVGLYHRFIVAP